VWVLLATAIVVYREAMVKAAIFTSPVFDN
jgi:hypothetical protein